MAAGARDGAGAVWRVLSADLLETGDDDEPLRFSGPPASLSGRIPLRNPGTRRIMLSRVDGISATVRGGPGPDGATVARIGRATMLAADETRQLPVTLALDPYTPPGRYELELEVAGRRRRAEVTVIEELSVDVRPTRFVVENLPRVTQEKLLVVSNRGNVALHVRDIGAVPLDDERLACRSLRGALREWAAHQDPTVEGYFVEVGRQARLALEEAGILRVHIADSPVEVGPGEERTLSLSIEVPSTLDQHTRYTGVAALYLTDLIFTIVPAAVSPAGTPRPARARRSPRTPPGRPARRTASGGGSE